MNDSSGGAATDPVSLVVDALSELTPKGGLMTEVEDIRARLTEPLRIAVAGRLKSGKSTLVNALLGQRIAPTDVGECTKIVTWFRYGAPERVELQLRDGTSRELQLDSDGMLPRDPGVPLKQIAGMQAWLTNDILKSFTLIDTPGLASVDDESAAATRKLLAAESKDAAGAADALLFVLNAGVREIGRASCRERV